MNAKLVASRVVCLTLITLMHILPIRQCQADFIDWDAIFKNTVKAMKEAAEKAAKEADDNLKKLGKRIEINIPNPDNSESYKPRQVVEYSEELTNAFKKADTAMSWAGIVNPDIPKFLDPSYIDELAEIAMLIKYHAPSDATDELAMRLTGELEVWRTALLQYMKRIEEIKEHFSIMPIEAGASYPKDNPTKIVKIWEEYLKWENTRAEAFKNLASLPTVTYPEVISENQLGMQAALKVLLVSVVDIANMGMRFEYSQIRLDKFIQDNLYSLRRSVAELEKDAAKSKWDRQRYEEALRALKELEQRLGKIDPNENPYKPDNF